MAGLGDSITSEQLVEASLDAIVGVALDGVTRTWNAGAEKIFGIATEHAIGVSLAQLIGTGDLVFSEGVLETHGRHRNGRALTLLLAIAKLDGHWVVTISDITLLRAREKAHDTQRLKRERLAAVGHELRTPLNAIIGFADLLHAGKVGPLSPDQQDYVGEILTAAQKLLGIVDSATEDTDPPAKG